MSSQFHSNLSSKELKTHSDQKTSQIFITAPCVIHNSYHKVLKYSSLSKKQRKNPSRPVPMCNFPILITKFLKYSSLKKPWRYKNIKKENPKRSVSLLNSSNYVCMTQQQTVSILFFFSVQ